MTLLLVFLALLALHYLADFEAQMDWMAINKSRDTGALLVHVTVYTAIMMLGALFVFTYALGLSWRVAYAYATLNGMLHWFTDWFTSRWAAAHHESNRHRFFCVIGTDQLIHHWTLGLTLLLVWPK